MKKLHWKKRMFGFLTAAFLLSGSAVSVNAYYESAVDLGDVTLEAEKYEASKVQNTVNIQIGSTFNMNLKQLVGLKGSGDSLLTTADTKIKKIVIAQASQKSNKWWWQFAGTSDNQAQYRKSVKTGTSAGNAVIFFDPRTEHNKEGVAFLLVSEGYKMKLPDNIDNMFRCLQGLTEIEIEGDVLDTSEVVQAYSVFMDCRNLKKLDLSSWKIDKLARIGQMFMGCQNLEELNLNGWKTKNIGNMDRLFANCEKLDFYRKLDGISLAENLTGWNHRKNVSTREMFLNNKMLTELDLGKWYTWSTTDMEGMFSGCENLTSLNLEYWDTSQVTNMQYMFKNCQSLTELKISRWNVSNVEKMEEMFFGCESLPELDLSGWTPKKAVSMDKMFSGCLQLENLNLDSWDTPLVTSMDSMFYNCRLLSGIHTANWDVSKVTDMSNLFYNCSSLKDLDLSSWHAPRLTSMGNMFRNCIRLESVNLKNLKPESIVNMSAAFDSCRSLTGLVDLSGWNTSKMTSCEALFYQCENIEEIDLTGWTAANVDNLSSMFADCKKLTRIYADSAWAIKNVPVNNLGAPFKNNEKLAGGQGTRFSYSSVNATRARLDDRTNNKPGYFTEKSLAAAQESKEAEKSEQTLDSDPDEKKPAKTASNGLKEEKEEVSILFEIENSDQLELDLKHFSDEKFVSFAKDEEAVIHLLPKQGKEIERLEIFCNDRPLTGHHLNDELLTVRDSDQNDSDSLKTVSFPDEKEEKVNLEGLSKEGAAESLLQCRKDHFCYEYRSETGELKLNLFKAKENQLTIKVKVTLKEDPDLEVVCSDSMDEPTTDQTDDAADEETKDCFELLPDPSEEDLDDSAEGDQVLSEFREPSDLKMDDESFTARLEQTGME